MSQKALDILLDLPYETITLFDGKKATQVTVVKYSEITKQIGMLRVELAKEQAKQKLKDKLSPRT